MKAKAAYVLILVGVAVTAFVLGRTSQAPAPSRSASERAALPEEPPARKVPRPRAQPEGQPVAAPGRDPREKPEKLQPPAGVITGRVHVPEDRSPLGVKVRLAGPGTEAETETDAQGEFRFSALPAGDYEITADQPGLPPRKLRVRLGESQGAGLFEIRMGSLGALRVLVVDAFGAPIRDQAVTIRAHEDRAVLARGATNENGEFVAANLALGQYWVERGRAVRTATVQPDETVDVIFEMAAKVTGRVLDPEGKPLVQAYVRLLPVHFGAEGFRSYQTQTDPKGHFIIEGIPEGDYDVMIQVVGKKSYVAPGGRVSLRAGETMEHTVQVESHALSGRITRRDSGAALGRRDVQITATPVEVQGGEVIRDLGKSCMAFASDDGSYTFTGLTPGVYRIWIASHLPDLSNTARIVDFSAGGKMDGVDFALEPRPVGRLRLRVLEPDGRPARGVTFSVQEGRYSVTLRGTELGDGLFEFVLEAGDREVHVFRAGLHAEAYVTIAEGEILEHEVQLVAFEK